MLNTIRIYAHPLSGHSHRVVLFANLIGVRHEVIEVDLLAGEHKKEPFLKLNPFGQVPVLVDGDTVVSDSNAILVYLARKYAAKWLPTNLQEEAQVQQFFSLAAGEIAFGPAAARLITVFGAGLDADFVQTIATRVFGKLELHLQSREWLVGDTPSVADVAIYSYVAHAPEGNVSLAPYPNIKALLARIEALPGFVPMPTTRVGLVAA